MSGKLKSFFSASVAIYALSLALTFGLDQVQKLLDHQTYSLTDPLYSRVFKPEFWYDKVTSIGPIKPTAEVKIIEFAHGIEPDNTFGPEHRCTARLFLAKLLGQLKRHPPNVIVIDRRMSLSSNPIECSNEPQDVTAVLRSVIEGLPTPVVIAADEVNYKEVSAYCPGVSLPKDTMILTEKYGFFGPNKNVYYGLGRFNEDLRKIPLGWFVYSSCDDARGHKKPMLAPSIDLVSTYLSKRTDQKEILRKAGLNDNFTDIRHPYTGFLRPDEIPPYHAIQLLCGKIDPDLEHWKKCDDSTGDDAKLDELGGQVVIIGDVLPDYMKQTVVGELPEFRLHASYISALRTERLFAPVRLLYRLILGLVWFAIIEVVFEWQYQRPEVAFLAALGATIVLGFIVYSFFLMYFGVFAVLVPPSLLAIVGKWISIRLGDKKKSTEVHNENPPKAAIPASGTSPAGSTLRSDDGVSQ